MCLTTIRQFKLWDLNLGKCHAELSGLPTDYNCMYMKILCQCIFSPRVKLKLRMVKKNYNQGCQMSQRASDRVENKKNIDMAGHC